MSKPNYTGTFHMVSQDNFENYLAALDINFALRKIVCMLKPTKQIVHDPATGSMKIRTLTTFKDFDMDFKLGQVFTEDLGPVDGRVCQWTGRVISWCVFREERRREEDGHTGWRETSYTWR
ncbi:retinol-binding protein 1 isoform X3 [Oncorhynchus tshawytscha]|uniref:retinol-binding protein 1 isoform X3 n=1 Tax=Oncorhynchus tshawytscha TaxID=74940 RepID=UPI001C3D1EBA|nr:retinol-binding protein 1 isoform X3 [Oncorhynchus tshawytscha]